MDRGSTFGSGSRHQPNNNSTNTKKMDEDLFKAEYEDDLIADRRRREGRGWLNPDDDNDDDDNDNNNEKETNESL
jgi:hypothetical protein